MYRGRLVEFELDAGRELPRVEFSRVETRHRRRKVRGDCDHLIDGSEPYRYQVWKLAGEQGVRQLIECESCARVDARF